MEKEFSYIKTKYNKTGVRISELYDNYKPKFTYECFNCNKEFTTDKKRKSNKVFCSRNCCGISQAKDNHG